MVTKAKMSTQDLEWQAEEDARTIQRAEEIKADMTRLKRALVVAEKQAEASQKAKGIIALAIKGKA